MRNFGTDIICYGHDKFTMIGVIQILYLASLAFLMLWSLFKSKTQFSYILSGLFFFSFLTFILLFFTSNIGGFYKIPNFLMLLTYISITTFLLQRSLKNFWIAAFIGIASLAFAKVYVVDKLLSKKGIFPSSSTLDNEWEFIVELDEIKDISVLNEIQLKYDLSISPAFNPKYKNQTELDDYVVIGIPQSAEEHQEDILKELRIIKEVLHIEYNEQIKRNFPQLRSSKKKTTDLKLNDPLVKEQWSLSALGLSKPQANTLNLITPKKTALIVIIDSGVDGAHEDLRDNYIGLDPEYENGNLDHGTHCAGIACAVSNNRIGIASLVPNKDWVKVAGIKVFNFLGFSTQKRTIEGMIEAADLGADVISMSLGARSFLGKEQAYNEAVAYCNAMGAIVVVSAGNSNASAKDFSPVNSQNVIGVASINRDMERSSFSNTVHEIEMGLCAPGEDILSTVPNNKYVRKSGTSMAAPYVSSSVALLKAYQPNLRTQEAYDLLLSTGVRIDNETGVLIQPFEALLELASREEGS